ncbi:MAG: hypothetical protein ABEK59_10230 [Halobacteria archaeon]
MSDPNDLLDNLEDAERAFEKGPLDTEYEEGLESGESWKTQLTKACRYLESIRKLRSIDGYNGSVAELSFSSIERSIEAFLICMAGGEIKDFGHF